MLPLKTKQDQELVKAFQKILSTGRKPTKLRADQGTEFRNRLFQNHVFLTTTLTFLLLTLRLRYILPRPVNAQWG